MSETKSMSGWTSNIYKEGVQHYVKEGKEYTACSRYSIYEREKPELLPSPDKKRKVCQACLKSYHGEKRKKKEEEK